MTLPKLPDYVGLPVVRVRQYLDSAGITRSFDAWRYGHVVGGVTRGRRKGAFHVRVPRADGGTRTLTVETRNAWCPACGLSLAGAVARKIPGGITLKRGKK